ncbi:MerC domain-containing protein [Sulfidibacter corallicola]|uniref:MerC domain-containing protein n=1 Tax=Sulfidibacter corallicola TaxID=2818388 RepID=A0A8A4TKZ6_SULCO|nr:MerC domain-containing protein [Sulfidibacter corallicola]QTD50679.1 MerC domain-containing protein [Sulfidibacter corallicola]
MRRPSNQCTSGEDHPTCCATKSPHPALDVLGVGLSTLCLVHCLLLPLLPLLLAMPALPEIHDERVHTGFLVVIVPIALVALWRGLRHHGRIAVVVWGALGTVLLVLGALAERFGMGHSGTPTVLAEHFEHFGTPVETSLTVLGSVLLSGAHLFNRRCIHRAATRTLQTP